MTETKIAMTIEEASEYKAIQGITLESAGTPCGPCGMGKAASLKSRAEGTYQKRYLGEVHGSERGEEPAG